MNHKDINELSPEEQQLEKDLKDQLKYFKTNSPQGLEDRIFAALQKEHHKIEKRRPAYEWRKLLVAACLFLGLGLTFQYNATYLNNLINQKEEPTSLFTIFSKVQESIAKMDITEDKAQSFGEVFLAQQADAFMSDLAILTIDPTLEYMSQQKSLEDVIKRK